ncbi:MAG: N-acetyl sugar amidotransferase [Campylobacterales bacterium]
MTNNLTAYYGLPSEVKFCKKCVMSNQRPGSVVEFKNTANGKKPTIFFDEDGVCSACKYAEIKRNKMNWEEREKELVELCNRYRKSDGSYDCIVPGSGGKDSAFVSHILKFKYNMNPLTVTWSPHMYTDIGFRNFHSWIDSGFDNILVTPNGKVHRLLTKLAFENLCHPFQPFIIGQKMLAARFSALYEIPLVFYGEHAAEYGDDLDGAFRPTMLPKFYEEEPNIDNLFLGGVSAREISEEHNIRLSDLNPYLPVSGEKLKKVGTEVHHISYYLNWDPQENYYYAAEHTGFQSNTERTEGSFSKYSSIDDKIDPLHYYTTYIKFGIGRATYDAAQEIRNGKITREEGVYLVKKYDSELPTKYLGEILNYMDITEDKFWEIINKARSPHLWEKNGDMWKLRNQIV